MARTSKKGGFTMRGWTAGQGTGSHSAFTKPTDVSSKNVRERAYEEEHGESYQDSAEGTELGHTAMTELTGQDDTKQNIFRQIFKPGTKTIDVASQRSEDIRGEVDEHGINQPDSPSYNPKQKSRRTKTYEDEDTGEKYYFQSPQQEEEYWKQKEYIDQRTFNIHGDSATITPEGEKIQTPVTEEMAQSTHFGHSYGPIDEDQQRRGGYGGLDDDGNPIWVDADTAFEERSKRDYDAEKRKIEQLEEENEKRRKTAPETGVTADIDFGFEGELDPKYRDRERRLVLDEETGTITEKVKRKGPAGWLGMHKKTGREHVDETWAAEADAQKKIDEEKKNKKKNNKKKDNKKKDDSTDTNKKKKKDKDKDKNKRKKTNTPVDPGSYYNYGP
jgi:hypothetical protein